MEFKEKIYKLRKKAGMTQEQLAEEFGVSKQAVQKWEAGTSYPDTSKMVELAKRFGISLDSLVLDRDLRAVEGIKQSSAVVPDYSSLENWEFYASELMTEYTQSAEEGLDIEKYRDIFSSISMLPNNSVKKKFGDVIFELITNAEQKQDYKYIEPSELSAIRELRRPYREFVYDKNTELLAKIHGAWVGRISGCLLGKPVECWRTPALIAALKATDNYPMHKYIMQCDIDRANAAKCGVDLPQGIPEMYENGVPFDDDTNYTVLSHVILEKYGRDFTPANVAQAWLDCQPKYAYCTAERVAFCNFVKGYMPPYSAVYKNPYREWIGAQIRTDYYGYINPGDPETAAEMAWRDASVSHVKNGIYGAMLVSAMLATAAATNNLEDIILSGLAQIPCTSRLYEEIMLVVDGYKNGMTQEECRSMIHERWDENSSHGWCHTNSNAMIVVMSLLYGGGDFGRSVCMAVETGFDTDCNGATVGSVLGMANGLDSIPECWIKPLGDKLETTIFGVGVVTISEMAEKTMKHVKL